MARDMMPGVDVWLNNPLRPLEACGTSGMKVALNGGLNLSIRDGWWDEMFDGANGWAIPSADGIDDQERRDELEANALYDLIENNVRARFYERDANGLPPRWLEMVRHDLKSLGPQVLASRMVRDYVNQLYAPAAVSSRAMLADTYAAAKELAAWKADAAAASGPRYGSGTSRPSARATTPRSATRSSVRASVDLGGLSASDVAVEVVYGRADDFDELHDISCVALSPDGTGEDGLHRFAGARAARPYRLLRLQRPGASRRTPRWSTRPSSAWSSTPRKLLVRHRTKAAGSQGNQPLSSCRARVRGRCPGPAAPARAPCRSAARRADGDRRGLGDAVTDVGDGHLVAGGVRADGGDQGVGVGDHGAVDLGDDVALLQAGCRAPGRRR